MTAASNFFRRYTSTGQEGVAKQSIDQIEPVVEFKTLNEASSLYGHFLNFVKFNVLKY